MCTISKYKIILVLCSPFLWASFAWAGSTFDANIEPLFEACMARCSRTDTLGNLTREGCIKGCNEIRRTFFLRGKHYHSYASCLKDTQEIELNKDTLISKNQDWCIDTYKHPHKRVGCKDAIKVFIDSATFENICSRAIHTQKGTTSAKEKATGIAPIVLAPQVIHQSITKTDQDPSRAPHTTVAFSPVIQESTSIQKTPPTMTFIQQQKLSSYTTPATQSTLARPTQPTSNGPLMQPLAQKMSAADSPRSATSVLLSAPLIKDTPKYSSLRSKIKKSVQPSAKKVVSSKKEASEVSISKNSDSHKNIYSLQKDIPMPGNETYPGYVPLNARNQYLESSSPKKATLAPTIKTTEMLQKHQTKSSSLENSMVSSTSSSLQQTQSNKATTVQKNNEDSHEKMGEKKTSSSSVSGATTAPKGVIPLPVASQSIQTVTKKQNKISTSETAVDNKTDEVLEKQKLPKEENSPRMPAQNSSQTAKSVEAPGKDIVPSETKDLSKTSLEHGSAQNMAKETKVTNSSSPLHAQKSADLPQEASNGTTTNSLSSLRLDQPHPVKGAVETPTAVISTPIPSFGVPVGIEPSVNSSSKNTQRTSFVQQQLKEQSQTATQLKKTDPPPPQPYGLSLPPSAIKAPPAPLP